VRPAALARQDVWCASDLPAAEHSAWPTGFGLLDAQLPGGGWPCGALTEVLQTPGQHLEWQLLGPALASRFQPTQPPQGGSAWVVVGAPHVPLVAAMQARGLNVATMVCVEAADPAQRLWACEQALLTPSVGAVLAWLPHAPPGALRRLQHAASRGGHLLWLFRPDSAAPHASPAVLRVRVAAPHTPGWLGVTLLKRRGPPLPDTLLLPSPDEGLHAALAGARWRSALRRQEPVTSRAPTHAMAGTEAHA
jgi:protein ImuA